MLPLVASLQGKTRTDNSALGRKYTLQPGQQTGEYGQTVVNGFATTGYGSTAFTSLMTTTPDIPLREPLEFEYRVNRKIAKKIYHEEKQQRVQSNKERCESEKARQLQQMLKDYQDRELTFIKDRRHHELMIQTMVEKKKEQRQSIAEKCQKIQHDRERVLREKERAIYEEIERQKKLDEEKQAKKKEDMFLIDLERERDRKDMKGKYMTQRQVSTHSVTLIIARAIRDPTAPQPLPS